MAPLAVSCISLSEKSHEFRQNSFESKLREEEKYSHISLAYITYSHNMADCVVYLMSTSKNFKRVVFNWEDVKIELQYQL